MADSESNQPGNTPLLSVVMPVYNEEKTLRTIVDRVMALDFDKELILVDDGSKDGSIPIMEEMADDKLIRLIKHKSNQGKAGALATGFAAARGDIVIIQDADLEYNPEEYPIVLQPIIDNEADVVFGSRFQNGHKEGNLKLHYVANRLLTFLSNLCTNLNLTDMETCYKAFRREVIQSIHIESKRFAVEPELTQKVAKLKVRVAEVPVSYQGRDYSEGKKIGLGDAFEAVLAIFRFKFFWYPPKKS